MTSPDMAEVRRRPVLFLDFDGVLHPSLCLEAEHFCRRPLFEEVMRLAGRLALMSGEP
ncbi:MAG: hypothetical protein BroJett014_31730 [Planctomycetota bacterium]|nr:hypothetical protein [Rhodocyclaceae bacterium]GIK54200.1 MAG: hypothetical protein BroJett014_31730 [Planctomycetota bacterium]